MAADPPGPSRRPVHIAALRLLPALRERAPLGIRLFLLHIFLPFRVCPRAARTAALFDCGRFPGSPSFLLRWFPSVIVSALCKSSEKAAEKSS